MFIRCLLAIVLALPGVAEARPRGSPFANQIYYNIVTDGGATCNGIADDAPAFKTFNTWALANQGTHQVVLTIPAGKTCLFSSSESYLVGSISLTNAFLSGIKNVIVEGNGSTFKNGVGTGFQVGTLGLCEIGLTVAGGCSARLQSISPGASTITLTAASVSAGYISRFSVGSWVMIGGLDTQGTFLSGSGSPPNNTYFEWRQIVSCNASPTTCTGSTITLDRSLTKTYLSTWPEFTSGDALQNDAGGPATIWALPDQWNATVELRDLTLNSISGGQINGKVRNITYRNVTFPDGSGIPSQNETFSAYNTSWANTVEVDKLIGAITLQDVSVGSVFEFQSNSVDTLNISGSSTIATLHGGAKQNTITDATITDWLPGTTAYGANQGSIVCTRCAITNLFPTGPDNAAVFMSAAQVAPFIQSSGLIQWPISLGESQRWASTIGANYSIGVGGSVSGPVNMFQVQTVTGDPWPAADNQTLTTTVSLPASANPTLNVPSAPFTSGDVRKTIIINGAGAGGIPFRTYIVSFINASNVVVAGTPSTALVSSSQTIQWGTANVYVQTSMPAGFPAPSDCCLIQAHPAPVFTCDACTGDGILTAMNVQQGATPGAPIGQFAKRSYAPSAGNAAIGGLYARGKITSLTIDVTTAYTGSGSSTLQVGGQFNNYETVKQSDWSTFQWAPIINLKQTGTRVYTNSGGGTGSWTCNGVAGGCSGDTVTGAGLPPEQVWLKTNMVGYLNGAFSGGVNPQFSMTVQTNQSVVP